MANTYLVTLPLADETLYTLVYDLGGQVWDGAAFVAFDEDDLADYAQETPETPTPGVSCRYEVTMPAGIDEPGLYRFVTHIQEGGAAAADDPDVETRERLWDGTDWVAPPSAADVWTAAERTLTQSAAAVTAAVAGSDLTIRRGDNWVAALTGLGSVVGATKIWFTAKSDLDDLDAAAVIQIDLTGLRRLNGAAGTLTDGSITVDSAAAGNLTLRLKPAATKLLEAWDGLTYDVQVLTAAGAIETRTAGALTVEADVTLAVA